MGWGSGSTKSQKVAVSTQGGRGVRRAPGWGGAPHPQPLAVVRACQAFLSGPGPVFSNLLSFLSHREWDPQHSPCCPQGSEGLFPVPLARVLCC